MSKLVLSGAQPSGNLHIGNYFGALKQFVDLQETHECRFFLADLHALTTVQDAEILRQNIYNQVRAYVAIGLDPERTIIFKQSDIPEVTELAWIFNCLTTMPYLMRAHSFKDAEAKNKEINVGVFDYPILMSADILIQNADLVPVGKDQKQHVEIARETARKFNAAYGDILAEPQEYIVEEVETVPGTDGQKMSKSKGNTIPLFGSREELAKAIMSIPTDSAAVSDPKDPDTSTLFKIHALFLDESERAALAERYRAGGLGYKEAKDLCIEAAEAYLAPMRQKYNSITDDDVRKILLDGKIRVRPHVISQMEAVRKAVGLEL